jgi:cell wall-associated NlpC family hydrolase
MRKLSIDRLIQACVTGEQHKAPCGGRETSVHSRHGSAGPESGTGFTTGATLYACLRQPTLWAATMLVSGTIFAATQSHPSAERPVHTVFKPLTTVAAAPAGLKFEAIRRVAVVVPDPVVAEPVVYAVPSTVDRATRSSARNPVRRQPSVKRPARKGTGAGYTRHNGYTGYTGYTVPAGVADSNAALAFALSKVGQHYRRNGSADGGWDCSGLVSSAYARAGVALPHSSGRIGSMGRAVPKGQWKAGDVIHTSGHVALYLGNGMMVEAANPKDGVRVAPVRGGTARRF